MNSSGIAPVQSSASQATRRGPRHQVSDEPSSVDLTCGQGCVEPVQERVLAEQPLAVGDRQRLSDLPS
jgi:hypothetical protein